MSTVIYRKCKNCGYYQGGGFFTNGWCHWLGKPMNPNNYECEDGYNDKKKKGETK